MLSAQLLSSLNTQLISLAYGGVKEFSINEIDAPLQLQKVKLSWNAPNITNKTEYRVIYRKVAGFEHTNEDVKVTQKTENKQVEITGLGEGTF